MRPAPADRGPGRWLRVFAGVREDILAWVPALRPYYTGLGCIVLATSCLAALAMFTALMKIITAPRPVLIPIAMLWGLVILGLDRWLITSTPGGRDGGALKRLGIFVPRAVLAVIVALTIAEPMILLIFQPALDRQVRLEQQQTLAISETMLNECNPLTGIPVASSACTQYRLTLPNPPTSVEQQLSSTQSQAAGLQQEVGKIQDRVAALTTIAEDECAGVTAPGTSGTAGNGPLCKKDWAEVTTYENSSGLTADQQLLKADNADAASLTAQLATAKADYSAAVQAGIRARMTEISGTQQGQIGIIDEWNALAALSARNPIVSIGAWLIRLTFIVLDCLPITAKLIGGKTAYDRRLYEQLASDESVHDFELRYREDRERASRKPETRRRPRECRHDTRMARQLDAFLAKNPGMRRLDALDRAAEEGIRMNDNPAIRFVPGPDGRRRAALIAGPEVWEIMRELKSARAIRPRLREDAVLTKVAQKTRTSPNRIRAAIRYATDYPAEISEQIVLAEAADRSRELRQVIIR
jgi:hypothetical protein